MPAQTTCPISEVDRALSSYINTREDTLKIRRTISRYLTSTLRPVNSATQNQHLTHVCPQQLSAANVNPPGLKDTRLQYLQALRARNQAQTRHRELQASLQTLQQGHIEENPTQPDIERDNSAIQGYISLLRQRQRVAELQVIQDSLEKLMLAKPSHAPLDPKAIIKDKIGEQPDLPAERLEQISQNQDDQTGIFKLKQEVLESKAAMERAQAARQKAQDEARGQHTLQAQVHALECARDEIHEWVQGELAKLEEDSLFLEDASPIKRSVNNTPIVDITTAEVRIREAYEQYTSSRAWLLEAYASLQLPPASQTSDKDVNPTAENAKKATDVNTSQPSRPLTKLLPYLPHLTQTANEERSLLRQTVFLQAQIASADQDIEEALLRLSGESHLLPAGSKDISAWTKTAREAEAATEEFVRERLQASRQELGSVSAVVELNALQSRVFAAV
jgi:hypothetical protein